MAINISEKEHVTPLEEEIDRLDTLVFNNDRDMYYLMYYIVDENHRPNYSNNICDTRVEISTRLEIAKRKKDCVRMFPLSIDSWIENDFYIPYTYLKCAFDAHTSLAGPRIWLWDLIEYLLYKYFRVQDDFCHWEDVTRMFRYSIQHDNIFIARIVIDKYTEYAEEQKQIVSLLDTMLDGDNYCGNNYYGETFLHVAARIGNETMVLFLLDNGAYTDTLDITGKSALDVAEIYNHENIVRILVHRNTILLENSFRGVQIM